MLTLSFLMMIRNARKGGVGSRYVKSNRQYAQQKLIENRKILEERASKAHEESKKKKELIQQRVLSEVCPRNYG